jgi:cytochrome c553
MRNRSCLFILCALLAGSAFAQGAPAEATPPATSTAAEPAAAAPATPAEPVQAPPPAAAVQPGDPVAGQAKAAVCAACHNLDGNSTLTIYPKIAGQHERYIARQLSLFKSGERINPLMVAFAATLSPQDMRNVGAWFASQARLPGVASDEKIPGLEESFRARGERLYRIGNVATGMPACRACHGPSGLGNPGAMFPNIGGQHADYVKARLLAFRTGEVWGKGPNANVIMAAIARNLSDQDIDALSSYVQGLHETELSPDSAAAR